MTKRRVLGYRRENGGVGVRNHVIILPVDDISNAACEAVANNIKGTLALPHAYGRLQFGEDLELHFRTMIGTGSWLDAAHRRWYCQDWKAGQRLLDRRKGDLQTIAEASRQAKEYLQWASELQRTDCGLEELYISVKCGESDTTTGLASCPTVGNVIDKHCGDGSTASFGETGELTGVEKLGKRTKFVGCLTPASAPTKAGLWFMDTSSAAAEAVTLWAASGAVVHLFPTGQGNVIGNPIEPVIKLSGNPKTAASMSEHIDLDVSRIL
jgi:(2R)-sulfolactate sulfo-lyase subunit beta